MTETPTAPDERVRIAEEAYPFGFPLAVMEATRRLSTNVPEGVRPGCRPMNWFTHIRAFPPGDFKEVVRPNYDTLYSIRWFDVRREPLVVSVPDTAGRYHMSPCLDIWTDVFALVESRTTRTRPGHHALVDPGVGVASGRGGTHRVTSMPVGWAIGRIGTGGPADHGAVHAIQDGFVATPLPVWPEPPTPPSAIVDPAIDMDQALLDARAVGRRAAPPDRRAHDAARPTSLIDQPVLARMRRLGIRPGGPFDVDNLDPDLRADIEDGPPATVAGRHCGHTASYSRLRVLGPRAILDGTPSCRSVRASRRPPSSDEGSPW